ncbi:C-type lectin domain family 1 member A-like isoform X1 [Cavia porcellus]|uniref:C-type lectin domain family 1 member A-like isoform X1 n=2 Tax=Cavia porcellus TaxID=10141 RepID=UPI002FE027D8
MNQWNLEEFLTSEMSGEKVIYSDLVIEPPSQSQRRTRELSEAQRSTHLEQHGRSAPSSAWKLIALGMLFISMGLLLSLITVATKFCSSAAETYSENLTCSQGTHQQRLLSGNSKNEQSLINVQAWKCHPCDDNWHQYGSNCYFVSSSLTAWEVCKLQCASSLSTFFRFNAKEELDFVKKISRMGCHTSSKNLWTSLKFNGSQWTWLDGSVFTSDEFQLDRTDMADNQCKYIKDGQLLSGDCTAPGFCVCKKTVKEN